MFVWLLLAAAVALDIYTIWYEWREATTNEHGWFQEWRRTVRRESRRDYNAWHHDFYEYWDHR